MDRTESVRIAGHEAGFAYDLFVLRDVVRFDGTPIATVQRINVTGKMRQMGIEPGNLIAFSAQIDSYDRRGTLIATDLQAPSEVPPGVTYRFARPRKIAVVAYRG